MEPQVRYAKTSDGVNIAYHTMGSGPPFVWLSAPQSHLLAERRVQGMRDALDGTARIFTLVRLDPRGFGLSDREISDFSLDSMARDVEAVLEKERLGPVILFGLAMAAFTAIRYASWHPENVSHLILMGRIDSSGRRLANPIMDSLSQLAQLDWDLASDTIIRSFYGPQGSANSELAALLRASVNPPQLQAIANQMYEADVSELLRALRMPSLVIQDLSDRHGNGPAARSVAALIPDGRFVEIDTGLGAVPAIARFLASTGALPPTPSPEVPLPTGTAIILFADIVDSTALTERMGDAAFREKARGLDAAMLAAIRESGGTAVEGKTLGDGVLAVFTSAKQAITCAQACHAVASAAGLALHAGIHAGDVIREADNVYGGAVNIAARIAAASVAGETLVSATVRELARTSAGVVFEDRGEQALKGIEDPVRVWAVRQA